MWMFYSAVMSALELQRTCTECGRKQKIPLAKKGKSTKCEKCGHIMPPPKYKNT